MESAEQELKDFSELFDLQHKRSVEADKLSQKRGKTMTSDELDAVASNALLAFPIRHHYECQADCKLCLDDHKRLADFLYEVGGIPRSRVDALGDYRRWLDRHKIYAEGPDGWGTRNIFDAANIKAYLREEWDCAAFDDANSTADRAAVADTVKLIVGNSGNDK